MRFSFRNAAYEIIFTGPSGIRYVSCDGGRTCVLATDTFWSLVDQSAIGFLAMNGEKSSDSTEQYKLWQLTDFQRAEMLRRFKYVKRTLVESEKPFARRNVEHAISLIAIETQDQNPPAYSTLSRWMKIFISSDMDQRSLIPRLDKKGDKRKKFPLEIESVISHTISSDYLTKQRISVEQTYCNVVGRIKEAFPSYGKNYIPSSRTIYRRIAEMDPYVRNRMRYGTNYAEIHNRAAGASLEVSRLMETVMIDGHRLDVIVVDPETGESLGRPFLVCLFDVFSRTVVGWHISLIPFCATTALAAIKDMCSRDPSVTPGGIPESILPDNGRDLSSNALRNLCSSVGMHIQPAKAYSPDDKAHLERFFRTVNEQLVHLLAGTTFSSPHDRGDYDSVKNACITVEQVKELFRSWVDDVYHRAIHSATERAPLFSWRDHQAEMPIMSYTTEEIDAVARVGHKRQVTAGRVIVNELAYKSDALCTLEAMDRRGVTVLVDEMNLGFVYVRHDANPEILIRADSVWTSYTKNLTLYEHLEVKKERKEMAEKDRLESGEFYYEISRWKLWQKIHGMKSIHARRLRLLTEGRGTRTITEEKSIVIAPDDSHEKNCDPISMKPDMEFVASGVIAPKQKIQPFDVFDI
jgi:putative transposase